MSQQASLQARSEAKGWNGHGVSEATSADPWRSPEDEAEIIRIIEAEAAAWLDCDIDAWAKYWVNGDHVRRFSARVASGASVAEGFQANRQIALGPGLITSS